QQDRGAEAARRSRGQRLWGSLGCVACHGDGGKEEGARAATLYRPPASYLLTGLGSKTTPERLAAYLQDPLAVAPAGRMPNMVLPEDEAQDLAHFLCASRVGGLDDDLPPAPGPGQRLPAFARLDDRPEERAAFARLPEAGQWQELGKRLVIDR